MTRRFLAASTLAVIAAMGAATGAFAEKLKLSHQWSEGDVRHKVAQMVADDVAAAGVDRFTIERVLNHTDSTVGGIYDRYGYDKEKRTALERWERRLRSIIGEPVESKIVEIG